LSNSFFLEISSEIKDIAPTAMPIAASGPVVKVFPNTLAIELTVIKAVPAIEALLPSVSNPLPNIPKAPDCYDNLEPTAEKAIPTEVKAIAA
jgi:hypothetical protein